MIRHLIAFYFQAQLPLSAGGFNGDCVYLSTEGKSPVLFCLLCFFDFSAHQHRQSPSRKAGAAFKGICWFTLPTSLLETSQDAMLMTPLITSHLSLIYFYDISAKNQEFLEGGMRYNPMDHIFVEYAVSVGVRLLGCCSQCHLNTVTPSDQNAKEEEAFLYRLQHFLHTHPKGLFF
jgi:hypothetical protein